MMCCFKIVSCMLIRTKICENFAKPFKNMLHDFYGYLPINVWTWWPIVTGASVNWYNQYIGYLVMRQGVSNWFLPTFLP